MFVGLFLSIAGCEYGFATSGVAALPTSSDPEFSSAWTVLEGALDWSEGVAWSARSRSDGSLETDSLTFYLHDLVPASGSAAGQNVCTYLFTRRRALIPSTRLTTSVTGVTASLVVDYVPALGISSYPATVYVDQEAIRVTGTPDNQHLTIAGSGQGYYGSAPAGFAVHTVDPGELRYPSVYAALPSVARRKVILWAVDDTNAATPLWRGTVGVGPELDRDGARFALQCEAIWTSVAAQTIGTPASMCRVQGYWGGAVGMEVFRDGSFVGGSEGGGAHYRDLASACQHVQLQTAHYFAINGITDITAGFVPYQGGVLGRASSASGTNLRVDVHLGEQSSSASSTATAGARFAQAAIPGAPPAILHCTVGSSANYFPVDGTTSLPTSWTATTHTDSGFTTTIAPSLRSEYSADEWIIFDIVASGANTTAAAPVWFTGPYLQGSFRFAPRNGSGVTRSTAGVRELVAECAAVVRGVTVVTTDHFAAGWRYVLDSATPNLGSTADRYDWAWTTDATILPALFAATGGAYAARSWEFDGTQRVGDFLKEGCALNGLALCLRDSRLAPVPVGPATHVTPVAATLTEADLCADPRWQQVAEEQITAIDVQNDVRNFRVVNATAQGLDGPGRTLTVKLEGQRQAIDATTEWADFVRYVLARVQGPYAEPIAALTIQVPAAAFLTTIRHGDYVDVSEWLAPAGDGSRGVGNAAALAAFAMSTQRAQVVGWAPDLRPDSGGTLELTLLLFAQVRGYAPACRVASSPTATSVVVATSWINAAGDASNPDAGAADGGASQFAAGDVVRLTKRDSTTETRDGPLTIQSITTTTVTFTGALAAGTRVSIAAGDWWDLVPADASEVHGTANATRLLGYAYVGSATAGVIDSLTDYPCEPWAP